MNCPNCGGTVPPGTGRCIKCGSYIEQPATAQQQPVQTQPAPPPQVVAAGPAVKSKVAAGVLGILLGGLGVHRFYLGYTGIGVLQLLMTVLFSWITCGMTAIAAWIWGLVEGIMILTGSINHDAAGRPLKE